MRVLILWADSLNNPNLGVRVLAEGMASLAQLAWKDPEIDIIDFPSDHGFGRKDVIEELARHKGYIRNSLSRYDVILDSGAGDSFADIYGIKRLIKMATIQNAAIQLRIPVIMGPQTIGPFNTILGRSIAKRVIRKTKLVIARDPMSARQAELLGRPVDLVATDVVFALPVSRHAKTRDVVFNASGLLWPRNNHLDYDLYRQSVYRSISSLLHQGRRVTIMPHVIGPDVEIDHPLALDNDVPLSRHLAHKFRDFREIELYIPTSLSDARSVLGSAKLTIASRMHCALNSLSMGTPAIPLAYSRKFGPLLSDLGWNWTVDLRESPDFVEELLRRVNQLSQFENDRLLQEMHNVAQERLNKSVAAMSKVVVPCE